MSKDLELSESIKKHIRKKKYLFWKQNLFLKQISMIYFKIRRLHIDKMADYETLKQTGIHHFLIECNNIN